MNDSFYLVLPSNASMKLYPHNKRSTFTVWLPHNINLNENWKVGLAEITYTKSWFNVEESKMRMAIKEEGWTRINPEMELTLPGNYYNSEEEFVNAINSTIREGWSKKSFLTALPEYGLVNKKLVCLNEGDATGKKFQMNFDPEIKKILGINENRPVFLNQAYTNLYVYSDLVYPSIIGDTTGPLLRVIDVDSSSPFGTQITQTFDEPYYHKLNQHNFQQISVYIRNDTGQPPYFLFGRVVVTLHFKRDD